MSEPLVKCGRPERRTWQTGTSREFWELIRQRRYKDARALVEERSLHGDAEAHCEMARLRRDEGYPDSHKSHLDSALLAGHPLALALRFFISDTFDVTEVMTILDPAHERNCDEMSWALNYVRRSGSALAEWILRQGMHGVHALDFDEKCHLQASIMADETSLAWILSHGVGAALQQKNLARLADYGVPEACYRAAGGGTSWSSLSSGTYTLCSYAERQAWLIHAAEQGYIRAAETLVRDASTHAPDRLPFAARQLVATVRPHLNPRTTLGRWSLRAILERVSVYPRMSLTPDLEREFAVYFDLLSSHVIARPAATLTMQHGSSCDLCELLRKKPVDIAYQQECLVRWLPIFQQKRDECKAATVALFGLVHRRKKMPRDIARFITKQVWESRLDMPYHWGVHRDSSSLDTTWSPAVFLDRK